jgi:hypothetical protein
MNIIVVLKLNEFITRQSLDYTPFCRVFILHDTRQEDSDFD